MDKPDVDSTIRANLADVEARIAAAARAVDRNPAAITLVAISKQHGAERVAAALAAGHRVYGENRVQEAQAKYPPLKQRYPDLELHLVGPLQSNKAGDAVALFDVIQTVDRPKIARALAKEMRRQDRWPDLFIEVNTGEETQKAGVAPDEVAGLLKLCRQELSLPVAGLMCIPPMDEEPAPHFALLADLARRHGVECISMGMSGDFETAIKLGATHVRVGTAIFGERPKR